MIKRSNLIQFWLVLMSQAFCQSSGWAQNDPIATLTESLKVNVVAIRATIDGTEEKGFGFITAEQNGRLYIATAAHVVRGPDKDKSAQKIQIKFYNDISWYTATFKYHWDSEDLALLEVNKPRVLDWDPNCVDLNPHIKNKVRFIGLNTNEPRWVDPGIDGNIFGDEASQLEFSITTISPGTSGAPLITERGIAGMITQDEGSISAALKITQIRKLFSGLGQYPYFDLQENNPYQMVKVEGGPFTMGCTSEQSVDCYDDEKPVHRVTLSSFSISKYEVTQAQWRKVMGSNPPELHFIGCDECPVEGVNWNDVQGFLRKLNAQTGKNYRLPTEAEWEYAARGGNLSRGYKYAGSNNIAEVTWYYDNAGSKTHPVGQKKANELGLYDMSGNVHEWCQDWKEDYLSNAQADPAGPSSGTRRVYRGGAFDFKARLCRVSARNSLLYPTFRGYFLGFRLAL